MLATGFGGLERRILPEPLLRPPETELVSSKSRNYLGQKKRAYLGLFGVKVLSTKYSLLLNLKLFYNQLQVGVTLSEAAIWMQADESPVRVGIALSLSCSH